MSKGNQLITADQAQTAGTLLAGCCQRLATVTEIEEVQGAVVGSMQRLAAMAEIAAVLNRPEVEAMIMFAAEAGAIETAQNVTHHDVLSVSKMAVCRGYLLADAAGPQFAVIKGKGGASFLVKEAGHRHKLRERGATQIKASAAALRVEPRANTVGKHDMLLIGEASCVLDGETFKVERDERMPIRLPCYETDGPDGHEAKARRRLIRDLWLTISGEEPTGEMLEQEESLVDVRPVTMIEDNTPEPPNEANPQVLFDADLDSLRKIAAKMVDKSERDALADIVKAITAADLETLQASEGDWTAAATMHSKSVQRLITNLIAYKRRLLTE
jgi:hypothetical protein